MGKDLFTIYASIISIIGFILQLITAAGSTTSSAGGLDCPLQGHVAFPPKGGLTNHVHYVTGGRLKAA